MVTRHLGNLQRTGIAMANGARVGPVIYDIQVVHDGSETRAFGSIEAGSKALECLHQAVAASVILAL